MTWDWDYLWHFLGGLAPNALLVCLTGSLAAGLLGVAVLFAFGWIREEVQHAWQWLTPHQWREAVAWPLGGLLALPLVAVV